MATASKDKVTEIYALLLLGVVLIAFFGGFIAGKQK
jgi:hypothetical protein